MYHLSQLWSKTRIEAKRGVKTGNSKYKGTIYTTKSRSDLENLLKMLDYLIIVPIFAHYLNLKQIYDYEKSVYVNGNSIANGIVLRLLG